MDMRDRFVSAAWLRGTDGPAHPLRANELVPHVHTAVHVYFDNSFENTYIIVKS